MQNFTLDLSQLTVVPDASKGVPVTAGPRQPRSSTDRALIETALEFGKPFNPSLGGALEVLEISKKAPTVKIVPSPTVPMTSKSSAFTMGVGITGTAAGSACQIDSKSHEGQGNKAPRTKIPNSGVVEP